MPQGLSNARSLWKAGVHFTPLKTFWVHTLVSDRSFEPSDAIVYLNIKEQIAQEKKNKLDING